MKNLWKDSEIKKIVDNPLLMRVYSSRLLGQNSDLVLHGGGNTSVKLKVTSIFGEQEDIIYVKGSGWDLGSIESEGFAPVKLKVLQKLAALTKLTDAQMVKEQRVAMINPEAPNPSVEAILHAIIPFKFVDHTHADAVVMLSNTPNGAKIIKKIYGETVLILPYVMPGFVLAKQIYEQLETINWNKIEGIILLNHGVFTFDDDAKKSYSKMIDLVTKAEDFFNQNYKLELNFEESNQNKIPLQKLAKIRKLISQTRKTPVLASLNSSPLAQQFVEHQNIKTISQQGTLTPDHVIRTKQKPIIFDDLTTASIQNQIKNYKTAYQKYFQNHASEQHTILDLAPRWAICSTYGTLSFGKNLKECQIIEDINQHTIKSILQAEQIDKWQPLASNNLFDLEYWELEQAKLKKSKQNLPFEGKIALVTGAASGIGKACVHALRSQGTVVAALDINPKIKGLFGDKSILEIVCDMTDYQALNDSVDTVVRTFGGLDILVSNAGIFSKSQTVEEMEESIWQQSLTINLSAHQKLMQFAIPYLKEGIEANIVIVGSKNVAAPGAGAGAYSVAKAGLNQLARIAAMELASDGIRVNTVHPNAVFDTAIWTEEVLQTRAKHYKMTVQEYKSNNLLKTEITSDDVAKLIVALTGQTFSKITGSQIPIDGGNLRVI